MTALENRGRRAESGVASTLAGRIDAATERITRFTPAQAFAAAATGALILDIRSEDARRRDGVVPGALAIPRTVLEWRVALDSPWRHPSIGGDDTCLILLCDHGCSSILAAADLVTLGFELAGDVVGGFAGWRAARLPVRRLPDRPAGDGSLPGTGPPD